MNLSPTIQPESVEHTVAYRNETEFSSWPFNAGMWRMNDNNILLSFMNAPCDYTVPSTLRHTRIDTFGKLLAIRSSDRGKSWGAAEVLADQVQLSDELAYGRSQSYTTPHDFDDPETIMCCYSTPHSSAPNSRAWIRISGDGGRSWGPAVLLPDCQIPRYQGRSAYVVRPDGALLLFLTAKPSFSTYDLSLVFISLDGGCGWALLSFLPGSSLYRTICPSPVVMADGRIAVAVRCKLDVAAVWDELLVSGDDGLTWKPISRINEHGDTIHLTQLGDGRLLAIYGYRLKPYGLRGKVSQDAGQTWGPEIIIRDDGGSFDLGYPRAVELSDGSVLAAYYMNDKTDPIQMNGGVRYIAASHMRV